MTETPLNINETLDASIDAGNWQVAAQCILANPLSQKFTQDLTRPLAQIALDADLQASVADEGKFIAGCARIIDHLREVARC